MTRLRRLTRYLPDFLAGVLLTLMCITVNPVLAQTETPMPRPTPVPVSAQQVLDLVRQTSQSDGSTVNASVLLLGFVNLLIFGATILFIWKGGLQPLQTEIVENREDRQTAEREKSKLETDYALERKQFGETLDRAVNVMAGMETQAKADLRANEIKSNSDKNTEGIKANSDKNTGAINDHTDAALQPLTDGVGAVLVELQSIRADVSNMVKQESFDTGISEIHTSMGEIRTRLDTVIDELKRTAETPGDVSPATDITALQATS